MKILITHFYTIKNRGDAVIAQATISELRNVFKEVEVSILSMDMPEETAKALGCTCHRSLFGWSIYATTNYFYRLARIFYMLVATTLWSVFRGLFGIDIGFMLTSQLKNIAKEYAKADLILAIGGGYFRGNNTMHDNLALTLQTHALLVPKMLGKKLILHSQSFGPFGNKLQTTLVGSMFRRADLIFPREHYSIDVLRRMNVPNNMMTPSVDSAFLFRTNPKHINLLRSRIKNQNKIVGITVRDWFANNPQGQKNYDNQVAKFTDWLANEGYNVVFVPQVTASLQKEDDRKTARRIYSGLKKTENVTLLEDDFSIDEIASIYSEIDYFVGTRMHSNILSLLSFKPVIAIAYEHKTLGIMEDLNLQKWVIDINEIDFRELKNLFVEIIANEGDYVQKIKLSIPEYSKRASESFRIIREFSK